MDKNKKIISKFKCPRCGHKFTKSGQEVSTNLYFCVCEYCVLGMWIDISTGKDFYGKEYKK